MTSWLLKISSSQVLSYIDRINYIYNTYICILIFSFVLLIIIISSNIKNIQIECTKFVVYWVIANPSKYRSGVYTIQLVVPRWQTSRNMDVQVYSSHLSMISILLKRMECLLTPLVRMEKAQFYADTLAAPGLVGFLE